MDKMIVKIKEGIDEKRWYKPGETYLVYKNRKNNTYKLTEHISNIRMLKSTGKECHIHRLKINRLGIKIIEAEAIDFGPNPANEDFKMLLDEKLEG